MLASYYDRKVLLPSFKAVGPTQAELPILKVEKLEDTFSQIRSQYLQTLNLKNAYKIYIVYYVTSLQRVPPHQTTYNFPGALRALLGWSSISPTPFQWNFDLANNKARLTKGTTTRLDSHKQ